MEFWQKYAKILHNKFYPSRASLSISSSFYVYAIICVE